MGESVGSREKRRRSAYTAQAVADFCEVDLKTVHHWADRGKIAHFRTEGRHLRFRRNDVIRFLRAHEYPLPAALTRVRPTVSLALPPPLLEDSLTIPSDLGKRLSSAFAVQRHANGAIALAHLLVDEPDALVLAEWDATLRVSSVVSALKSEPALSWIVTVALTSGESAQSARVAGADLVLDVRELTKLPGELARELAASILATRRDRPRVALRTRGGVRPQ